MRQLFIAFIFGLLFIGIAGPGLSQNAGPAVTVAADDGYADGEIRRIDRESLKITIRHGELRHLNMPPMTMVFQVRDPTLLDRARPGDRVRFRAEEEAGQFFVTDILPAP
jgi:Cu/Ag efflux protein CusF